MTEQDKVNTHAKATTKYNALNVKQIKLNLNRKTDAEIITYLEQVPNIQGLIKDLIRDHMRK